MAEPDKSSRIVKNTLFLYLRMFILLFVGFYTTRVILSSLGVDDFGLYNVIAGFVAMISFVNTSISNSIQRFLNFEMGKGKDGNVNRYFSVALTTQLIVAGIIVLLAETVGLWLVNCRMNIPVDRVFAANVVYQASIITVVLKIFQSPFQAIVIAKEKMQFYAYQSLIEAFIQLAIAYFLAIVPNFKLELYSVLLLVLSICLLVWNIIYSKKIQRDLILKPMFDSKIFKEVFAFCGWNLWGSAAGVVTNQGVNVVINIFFGVAINAARGVAMQVYSGVQRFIANFQIAMNPQIVQSYASNDKERYIKLCYANFKVSVYLMWIIVLPLMVSCQEVLGLWLGDNIPSQTLNFVYLALMIGLVEALGSSISVPLYATGDIKKYQVYVSVVRMLALPVSYLLYKLGYPPVSSMVSIFILEIIAQIIRVLIWANKVNTGALYYLRQIVIPLLIIIFCTYSLSYWAYTLLNIESRLLTILLTGLITLLLNIPSIFFLALSQSERNMILRILKKQK